MGGTAIAEQVKVTRSHRYQTIPPAILGFWLLCILTCLIYLIIAFSAPVLSYLQSPATDIAYKLGRTLCVQRPSRCLWIFNDHTALCAKCIGQYSGFMVVAIIACLSKKWRPKLFLGISCLLVSFAVWSHSIYRSIFGGMLAPLGLSLVLGLLAGCSLAIAIWSVFFKWEDKVMWFFKKAWLVILVLVFGLHCLGFASAFAADKGKEQPEEIKVPSGTPVILEVETGFSTDEVKEGDTIALLVQRPVRVNRVVVIRQGVAARAKIISARAASGWGGAGEISLDIRSVPAVDGSEIMLRGRATRRGETEHGTATALGVGAGVLCLPLAVTGFAVKGEEGKFPIGYEIVAYTAGDHFVQILPEEESKAIAKEQKEEAQKTSEQFKKHIEEIRKKKEEEAQKMNEENF